MKKIIALGLLIAASVSAQAQTAYAWRLDQRNAANTAYLSKFMPPDTTVACMASMDSISAGATPSCLKLSGAFVISGGVIDVPVTTGPQGPQGIQGIQGIQGPQGNTGNQGIQGSQGNQGVAGDSAYQVAVNNGFSGTQPQWLTSLIGPQGPQGPAGTSPTRSFSYMTRSLNTCFQVSSTRDAWVVYAVDIATQSTLASGQAGTVYLRTYSNSGCTTGTQEIMRFASSLTQALGLTVTLNMSGTGTLTGFIPAGAYVQLVTENNTGTPTFTARPGQEVLQ